MDYITIGKNIENLRKSQSLKQQDFAEKLSVSRPTVSNWEKGKSCPTTEQLIRIYEIFHISTDKLLGLENTKQIMLIADSSILCRRPRILDEMNVKKKVDYICITETILSEMNWQKDKGKRKQQAWLAMKSFDDFRKNDEKKFRILREDENEKLNDDKIINSALNEAKKNQNLMVYLISEDIYFPLKAKTTSNFKVLSLNEYEKEFSFSEEAYNKENTTSFYSAVKSKNIEQVKKIKLKNPDINHIDSKTGWTPCIQAIRNKDIDMLKYLISLPGIDLNKCDESKYKLPPISHSVQINNLKFIELLLESGADIDKGSQGKNYGNTALMIAAWNGKLEIVKYLVERGACCNQQDFNGYTPLIKACIRKHIEVANYLFDKTDKNIHDRYNYKTAKDYALQIDEKNKDKTFEKEVIDLKCKFLREQKNK